MSQATLGEVLGYLRKTCAADAAHDLTDAELLTRFLHQHDEAAFALLVQRHGPLVLGVCRRVLGDGHAAEDAFQATFLVLVRRAAAIGNHELLGGWLYAVARRVALKARAQTAAQRRREERRAAPVRQTETADDLTWQELRAVLDEEVGRLPPKYRAAVVHCYLEGRSYEQAAQQLGWPKSSLANRLARARDLLRKQLVRRGIALSAAALAAVLTERAAAVPVTALLTINTVRAVAGRGVSPQAALLAREALTTWLGPRAKALLALLALGLALGGSLCATAPGTADRPPAVAAPLQTPPPKAEANGPAKQDPAVDRFGDPLPAEAVARLGTVRFRHGTFTTRVAFALGGKALASAGGELRLQDGFNIRLWDAADGRLLRQLPGSEGSALLAVSADGKLLLTQSCRLIDLATDKELQRFQAPRNLGSLAISRDGQLVAAGEADGQEKIYVWEVKTGKLLQRLEGHTGRVPGLGFAPDGKTIASASDDKTVRLWSVATGQEMRRFAGPEHPLLALAFAPAGNVVAAADDQGTTWLWDADTGKLLHKVQGDRNLAFSPSGKLLATACGDGLVRLWDVATGKELRKWTASHWGLGGLTGVAFAPDGKTLATVGLYDHSIRLWDADTGAEIRPSAGHTGVVVALHFAADGRTLFSSGEDQRVIAWDVAAAKERERLFSGDRLGPPQPNWIWRGHDLSADGKVLAVAGALRTGVRQMKLDGTMRLLDTVTGKELGAVPNPQGLRSLRLAPDGKRLAADAQDGIHVWDAVAGKELLVLPGHRPHRGTLVFSPDGSLLVWAGDQDRSVHVHDAATGKEIRTWPTGHDKLRVLAFSADGKMIATAGRDDVSVWAAATGKALAQFRGQSMIESLAFSPSGRVLAAGEGLEKAKDAASAIYLWEVASGKEIRTIAGMQGSVPSLAFAPDGRTLASGGGDSTILLWDLAAGTKGGKLTAAALDGLWADLAGDAGKADRALWALARAPQQTVPFLKEALRPAPPADAQQIAKLVGELDDKNFQVRDQAVRALEELGAAAEAALRKAVEGKITLEVRQRLEQILAKRDKETVRQLRAVEVLEMIGTAEARQALEGVAKSTPNPRVAEAAGAALRRLAVRGRASP
jgi:RNA polymerase sigma factor (sigma-70 family)